MNINMTPAQVTDIQVGVTLSNLPNQTTKVATAAAVVFHVNYYSTKLQYIYAYVPFYQLTKIL
jgi:hypothetical protein